MIVDVPMGWALTSGSWQVEDQIAMGDQRRVFVRHDGFTVCLLWEYKYYTPENPEDPDDPYVEFVTLWIWLASVSTGHQGLYHANPVPMATWCAPFIDYVQRVFDQLGKVVVDEGWGTPDEEVFSQTMRQIMVADHLAGVVDTATSITTKLVHLDATEGAEDEDGWGVAQQPEWQVAVMRKILDTCDAALAAT